MDKNVCRKVPPLSMMFKIKFNTRCYSVTKVQSHIQYPSYGISQFTHFIHLRSKKNTQKKTKKLSLQKNIAIAIFQLSLFKEILDSQGLYVILQRKANVVISRA